MKSEINFLPKTLVQANQASKRIEMLRYLAIIFVFIVPITSITIFLLTFFSPISQYQITEKNLLTSTQVQNNKIAKVEFIIDRVNKASQFIAQRNTYDQLTQTVYQQVPADTTIINYTIINNTLTIEARSPSLLSLKDFQTKIENLANIHVTNFKILTLVNNLGDTNNNYLMTASMNIK